ncbi:MAG: L-ascorbate metabolism protein UlaG (beta-lactamase superfamily) [Paracoccaceae bacterium]|jgi:L-ascorbate metabolism protein UlaG (beta-lactamase superfamily)
MLSRRTFLSTTAGAIAGATILPYAARAAAGGADSFATANGTVTVHPVAHASFVMQVPGMVIYNDPVGDPAMYARFPKPDLILITHEHGDHYNADTLAALVGPNTKIIANPAVQAKMPEALAAMSTQIANGGAMMVGDMKLDAVPAYNTTEERLKYHPKGRDNGYVLTIDAMRIYIAGDTEDTPEMRALTDIDLAFVPMNLPYTMDVGAAASAVNAFKPRAVYPYHYRDSDPMEFARLVEAAGGVMVHQGPWYG